MQRKEVKASFGVKTYRKGPEVVNEKASSWATPRNQLDKNNPAGSGRILKAFYSERQDLVEMRGIEPLASALRTPRSPS